MNENFEKIEKIRRLIDKVAYYSLFLDICIASITTFSLLHIGNPEPILIPVNYLLTIVVVLSIGLFVTLFYLKHEENIMGNLMGTKYKFKHHSRSLYDKIKSMIKYYRNKHV
jgi:hypothetical protein